MWQRKTYLGLTEQFFNSSHSIPQHSIIDCLTHCCLFLTGSSHSQYLHHLLNGTTLNEHSEDYYANTCRHQQSFQTTFLCVFLSTTFGMEYDGLHEEHVNFVTNAKNSLFVKRNWIKSLIGNSKIQNIARYVGCCVSNNGNEKSYQTKCDSTSETSICHYELFHLFNLIRENVLI